MTQFFSIFDAILGFFSRIYGILVTRVDIPSSVASWLGIPTSIPLISLLSSSLVIAILVAALIKLLPLA